MRQPCHCACCRLFSRHSSQHPVSNAVICRTVISQDSRLGIQHGTLGSAKAWPVQISDATISTQPGQGQYMRYQFVWFGGHLDGLIGAQPPPRVRHVDGPVQPDDVGAGGAHALQQAPAAIGVQRDRRLRVPRLHRPDDVLQVRPGPLVPLLQGGHRGIVNTRSRTLAMIYVHQGLGCNFECTQVDSPQAVADRPTSRRAALHRHPPLSAATHRSNVTPRTTSMNLTSRRHSERESCCHAWVLNPGGPSVPPCLEAHVLGDLDGQVLQQR